MQTRLDGKKVALLATDGFEQEELFRPRQALLDVGAEVAVISMKSGSIKGWLDTNWGQTIQVDMTIDEANPGVFDALMLPGGVMNPDTLRNDKSAVEFVQSFVDAGKPIAAICHGSQILIETDALRGRKVTSWPSLKTDLLNAGAFWLDQEVVSDKGLVTSRKPSDIPAFNKKMIEEFAEGIHDRPRSSMPQQSGLSKDQNFSI